MPRHEALSSRMRSSHTTETETMQGRSTPSCSRTKAQSAQSSSSERGEAIPSSNEMSKACSTRASTYVLLPYCA